MNKRSGAAYLVVLTTISSRRLAAKMAKTLIRERLVACATILDKAESFYEWKGKMVQAGEVLIIMKTRASRYSALEEAIRRLHSYEVPEIISLSVVNGYSRYLAWIFAQTDRPKQN